MFISTWLLITLGAISAIAWVVTGVIIAGLRSEREDLADSNAWVFMQWQKSNEHGYQAALRSNGYRDAYQRSMKLNRSLIEQNHNLLADYKAVVGALEYDEADTMLVD